jgi:hypothetical protein
MNQTFPKLTIEQQEDPPAPQRLRIGDEAPQLVLALPRLIPSLTSLLFHTYFPGPGLEERLAESNDATLREIFQKAQQLRELSGNDLPYWESIIVSSWSTAKLDMLVDQALRHDFTREANTRFAIRANELAPDRIQQAIASLAPGWVLALCSRCEALNGSQRHIPMMDFRCAPSPMNLERTRIALKQLGETRGVILESGRSYHYYGFELQNHDQWIEFMARSLLLAPFIDVRFVAHRLIEGTSVLRLTSSKRKPRVPSIVAILSEP